MCNETVNTDSSTIQFLLECYKTQKLLINVLLHLFIFLIDVKLKKCMIVFSEDPLSRRYVLDQYKTQQNV